MAYAIIRAKKLKTMGAVSRSAQHTFRMQPTPNANPALTGRNRTVGVKGSEQILAALVWTLPKKRRKDAVLAIEYLVTASPEAFKRHGGLLDDMGGRLLCRRVEVAEVAPRCRECPQCDHPPG